MEYHAIPPEKITLSEANPDWEPGGTDRAIYRYKTARPDHIFTTTHLEGYAFTLPEIRSLLEDEIPPGHGNNEIHQVLDLDTASNLLIQRVAEQCFRASIEESNLYNQTIAGNIALDAGIPRFLSDINQDGRGATVSLPGNNVFVSYPKTVLREALNIVLPKIVAMPNPVDCAVNWAAFMSYAQVYMDGNKRTARYMMDGILMSHGFDCVLIRVSDKEAYNTALDAMFRSGDLGHYAGFLRAVYARENVDCGYDSGLDGLDAPVRRGVVVRGHVRQNGRVRAHVRGLPRRRRHGGSPGL